MEFSIKSIKVYSSLHRLFSNLASDAVEYIANLIDIYRFFYIYRIYLVKNEQTNLKKSHSFFTNHSAYCFFLPDFRLQNSNKYV